MFYTQFLKLCKEKGVKPTPLIKQLGFSSGNLKKWADGGSVNSETLVKLSNYFDVPIDYFFEENNETASVLMKIKKSTACISSQKISKYDLITIAKYLRCAPSYLMKDNDLIADDENAPSIQTPTFLISVVLNTISASSSYRFLQSRISEIIVQNILRSGIRKEDILNIGIDSIYDLLQEGIPTEEKAPLYYSDIIIIARKLNIPYERMLTGE